MKAIFNIAKNIRNSRSISVLSALRKLHGLGLVVCALLFGYVQVWGVNWYKVDNLSDITSGDSVLVVLQDGATLTVGKAFKVGAGTSSNSVDVTITSNSYISNPGTNIRWAMTKSGDNYVFKSSTNKYIGSSSSTNNNVSGNESSSYSWYITKLSNGYFKLQLASSSGRYISWKSAEFGKYANSSFKNQITLSAAINQYHGAISFYKKASGYAVTYNNGGHGTAPDNTTASAVTLSAITGVTGYTCTGWKANVAVTNTSTSATITAGTLIANGTNVTLSAATTFTAQWEVTKYTVTFAVNVAGYGTVSQSTVTNVPHGTVPSSSTNIVTVNGTTVTATPHAQDADYNYAFSSWSGIPGSVTSAVTITANFTRTARPLTNYRTTCCDNIVELSHNSPSNGTVVFSKTTVPTCDDDQTVTMTITPNAGYQVSAFSVGGTVTPTSTDPAVSVNDNSSAAQVISLTFEEDASGTYSVSVTFEQMHDEYYDYMHDNAKVGGNRTGNYSAPSRTSKTVATEAGCKDNHYKFMGWVLAEKVNDDGSLKDGYVIVTAGTAMTASNKIYYAIWAEED